MLERLCSTFSNTSHTGMTALPQSVNLQRVRYLYEAVRFGTLRAAADYLDLAPSAVSRQITLLESELATMFVERPIAA